MTSYSLGCDVGTTSVKTVLVDQDGKLRLEKQSGYGVVYPQPGWAEQDANLYWKAAVETIREAIRDSGINPADIAVIGLSGMAPNCVLVDAENNPLKPALIWMDSRAEEESRMLEKVIGREAAFQRSANFIHPYFGIPKLLWERNHHPDIFGRTAKVLSAKDYLSARLTGKTTSDHSTMALYAVAYDIRNKKWDLDMLKTIGIPAQIFPEDNPCERVIGAVSPQAAGITGLKSGTPVIAGTLDTGADATAVNTIRGGSCFLTMGTSICLGVASDGPFFAPGLMAFPHPVDSENKYITTGVVTAGGALLRWLSDLLWVQNKPEDAADELIPRLDKEAALAPPGSSGLIVLPYFMGERTPIWNPGARGVFMGLSLNHQRPHMVRALYESVGYALRLIIDLAERSGIIYNDPVTLIGGGTKSAVWNQILADITGKKMREAKQTSGAAVGAAFIAGNSVGLFTGYELLHNSIQIGATTRPNSETEQIYDEYYGLYKNLYQNLVPNFAELERTSHRLGENRC